jgi:hypothetical protein
LITLLEAGLGLLLRGTAGAVTAALALFYGSAVVGILAGDPKWQHRIHRSGSRYRGRPSRHARIAPALATRTIQPLVAVG